jgi:hypothetical protein
MNAWHLDSNCIVGGAVVDGDGDGWCLAEDPNDGNAAMPGQMASTPMDSAGIKYSADLDSDLDGYTNLDEWYMGVDPSNDCPAFSSHDAWPSDMDNSGTANLLDLLVFKPAFNCAAGTGCYSVRVDLDANDTVNLLDLLPFKPDFNVTCTFP